MQKVLIANQNVEQNNALCQHLSKAKRLEIIGITDGTTTLEKYLEIQPNILGLTPKISKKLFISPFELIP